MFSYADIIYGFTSYGKSITVNINGLMTSFNSEYIKRSDSLKTGTSKGEVETTEIYVGRDNSVALLYQGSPPENGGISLTVYRCHEDDLEDISKILVGTVSQVSMKSSEATLTITIENLLKKEIPNGCFSYYCQNDIYDNKCGLDKANYERTCYVDIGFNGLKISSTNLNEVADGFYTNGIIKMGNCWRTVVKHDKDTIWIKYPINESDKQGSFKIYAGCDGLFRTCAMKFQNTDNFIGVPYTQPTDPTKNPTGKGAYWVDSVVVKRDSNMEIGTIGM